MERTGKGSIYDSIVYQEMPNTISNESLWRSTNQNTLINEVSGNGLATPLYCLSRIPREAEEK